MKKITYKESGVDIKKADEFVKGMKTIFAQGKINKMSAFGSLYKIPVFVDKAFKGDIIFSSGSFDQSIKMPFKEFVKLEDAKLGVFSVAKKIKKQKINKPKSKTKPKAAPKRKIKRK